MAKAEFKGGMVITIRIACMNMIQANSGILCMLMPGARQQMTVATMLMAPEIEPMPITAKPMIQ